MAFGIVNVPGGGVDEGKLNDLLASRKINSKPLSGDISLTASDVGARPSTWTPTAADVGAVPTTRKVNGKPLSGDISLTASDVGARPSTWTPTAADVGAAAAEHDHSGYASKDNPVFTGSISLGRDTYWEAGECSVAIGYNASSEGDYSFSVGRYSSAEGEYSHAMGSSSRAYGKCSHAEGYTARALGDYSHAEGCSSSAYEDYSHAEGFNVSAKAKYQTVIGTYNVESQNETDRFIIGKGEVPDNGTFNPVRANCFRVTSTGVYASGAHNTSGADYAELFEWLDGNPDGKDRIGRFVTLAGDKLRLAGPEDDFILGVISGNPSVVGDVQDDQWQGMYLYDVYGRPLWEDVEVPAKTMEEPDPEDPEKTITRIITPAHTEHRQKINPDYDGTQKYIPRTQRPEWGCVGMMGKLVVIDDGSCRVDGWCAPGEGGIAVYSETRTDFRVIARIDATHVRVLALGRR